ncbi:MAG: hypothetical protein LBC52_00605 [Treponema sp.]|jgi:hypothetical protein|nr:hypothetical protein [Treponema sp.]
MKDTKVLCLIKYTGFLFLAAILFSCAGSPKGGSRMPPPLWVTDIEKVYPDRDWLVVVEAEQDAKLAERAAVTRLSQVFRVDLVSVTNANRQFAESVSSVKKKNLLITSQSSAIAQELISVSAVSGLIGLQVESWPNPNGRSYANARMNRAESSARYSSMIRENEKVISGLMEEAERNPRTFEAFQMLNLAYSFAVVTDNLHSLLTVLDPSAISRRPSYGNAEAVKSLAQNAGRSIVVTVKVDGDNGGRIEKAFTESLNLRGFRTSAAGDNPYVLSASLQLEGVDIVNPNNYKFARYILNYSLKDRGGVELFSSSDNGREGHTSESEARQRAIRAAEQLIATTGFAANFDAFFASLL